MTNDPSRDLRANLPPALIVAHGQPSDPAPAARDLQDLARRVSLRAAGRKVAAATLAEEGALETALTTLGPRGVVFPMFMSGGWFTRAALPQRMRAAGAIVGANGWQVLEPFGCDSAVHDLAQAALLQALAGQGSKAQGEVLIAAHGSSKAAAPSAIAHHLAATLRRALGLARCEAAFIDQPPQLQAATGFGPDAICLPFFAASGGHVETDLPAALALAGFTGRVLPPTGCHDGVPALIAAALARAAPVCAHACRWA